MKKIIAKTLRYGVLRLVEERLRQRLATAYPRGQKTGACVDL
jgi:hypothetical protein